MIRAGLVFLAPAMAAAQAPPQPPMAKVSEAEATKIALARIPGKATDVKIEKAHGGEKDVFVDIETGEIVGTD